MSIPSYSGQTYVGYVDISGFKEMMKNKNKAKRVLDKFYSTTYDILYEMRSPGTPSPAQMNAVVVSDCAILFLSRGRNGSSEDVDRIEGLPVMLKFIQRMNRAFIDRSCGFPFMTTCSIAYGDFQYQNRNDLDYLRKNCMIGTSYVNAFLDSESNESRMLPGECRIIKGDLNLMPSQDPIFSLLGSTSKYYYFYWMLENSRDIEPFKQKYKNTWEGTYERLLKLLQNHASPIERRR
jgi:hypothetical protein